MQANQITPNNTHNQDDPQIPARFAFRQRKTANQTDKGQEPKQQNHKKDLPRDTADFTHCVTLKNMHKLIVHHDILWNIEIEALPVASLS